MLNFIFGIVLIGGTVVLWSLLRVYQHVPLKEIKRLARSGDEVAQLLYRAAAYGMSLRVLLGGGAVFLGAAALACMVQAVGAWLAVLVLLIVIAIGGFVFVPADELTRSSLWLAKRAAPGISWLLERLQPVIGFLVRFLRRHRHIHVHTGLYEKADLRDLLVRQKGQPDSRIAAGEIELLLHNLSFGDTLVADAVVPKRVVKLVAASDPIGPVLMDELARSGHSRFPVYGDKRDTITGILYLHDLVASKHTGTVADVMSHKLIYVHENFTLYQALQAFLKTKHHLFLVVNSFEEFVGVLTIEDVLEQMIGKQIVDEFDKYDDLRAVAAAAARKDHAAHRKDQTELPPDLSSTTESTEVVK